MAGTPWECPNTLHAGDAHAAAHALHAPGPLHGMAMPGAFPGAFPGAWLGAHADAGPVLAGCMGAQPATDAQFGDAMRDDSSAAMPICGWAHRRHLAAEHGKGSESAMEEDGYARSSSFSDCPTPVAGVGGAWTAATLRPQPSASFAAASMPSGAAHRRPGTAASASTVQKWEQLLRDHPSDPMVSARPEHAHASVVVVPFPGSI